MQMQNCYCSARHREVRVALTEQPSHDAQAPILDADAVCLEICEACGGRTCPVLDAPLESLRFRLARDGFDTSALHHYAGDCDGCGRTTDLVALDATHFYCTECGTVNARHGVPDDAPTFED